MVVLVSDMKRREESMFMMLLNSSTTCSLLYLFNPSSSIRILPYHSNHIVVLVSKSVRMIYQVLLFGTGGDALGP
jgi:hypothetical protein